MPNSYSTSPGIIPGSLTVNGPLTVNSDTGIRIGGSAPFVRVFKSTVPGGDISYNLGTDEATLDTAAVRAMLLGLPQDGRSPYSKEVNPAGTAFFTELDRTIAQDGTNVGNTGNVTENTTRSKVIPANTLGADGVLVVEWTCLSTTQGATASTFRLKLGGTAIRQTSKTSPVSFTMRAYIFAQNVTNSQRAAVLTVDSAAVVEFATPAVALDTTLDQTLSVTIQNGAATDNWTDLGWKVHAVVGRAAAL